MKLIYIDTETTGLTPSDKLEVYVSKLQLGGLK